MKRVVSSIVVLVAPLLLNSSFYLQDEYDDYEMTKYQVTEFIKYYQEHFTEEILDHKYMEQDIKKELIYAYNKLKDEDKKPYTEFIKHVMSGGLPKVVSNKDKYTFNSNDNIDLYSLIKVNDPEDGNIILNSNNTKIDTNLNKDLSGTYKVEFTINDSDGNILKYSIYITIIKIDIKPDVNNNDVREEKEKVVKDEVIEKVKPSVPNTGF